MGIERPPFGYFTQIRVHESSRPKPKSYATEFKDPSMKMPDDFEKKVNEKLGKDRAFNSAL